MAGDGEREDEPRPAPTIPLGGEAGIDVQRKKEESQLQLIVGVGSRHVGYVESQSGVASEGERFFGEGRGQRRRISVHHHATSSVVIILSPHFVT